MPRSNPDAGVPAPAVPGRPAEPRIVRSRERTAQHDPLLIPALRAHMGDWVYYITFMKLKDLAERVSPAAEIHKSERLQEMIQRALKGRRAEEIKQYLLTHPQRLFNSVVIGVYGGEPQYYELDLRSGPDLSVSDVPQYLDGALGILQLSGGEKLFAIDGQHRLVGIKQTLKSAEGADLVDEEVSAIFVGHQQTEVGLERTRRLFSALNRYASPTSKKEIIALDEDDTVAIVTRRLVEEHPLFVGKRTSTTKTAQLASTDRVSFTTIVTIYDSLDFFLRRGSNKEWAAFKRSRPSDERVQEFYDEAKALFDQLIDAFPQLAELAAADDDYEIPNEYRSPDGGMWLFRPVGLKLLVRAIRLLKDQGIDPADSARRLAAAPSQLTDDLWANLLWDPVNRRMMTKAEEQRAAIRLMVYGAGGNLELLKTNEESLRKEIAGLKNVEDVQVSRFEDT
jgi:DNA sulfur modification protein DndB